MNRVQIAYNTTGAALLLAAGIVWLAGVDLAEALGLSAPLPESLGGALSHPVALPISAVIGLCLPSVWVAVQLGRQLATSLERVQEWRYERTLRPSRHVLRQTGDPAEPSSEASEPAPPSLSDAAPTDDEDADEDAVFGVIWRWRQDPDAGLSAHCPVCDDPLLPVANGGSLSRGLHCARCNKLRAAGEHPDEVHQKVVQALHERRRNGEWRSAPMRVDRTRSTATRPLVNLPAA